MIKNIQEYNILKNFLRNKKFISYIDEKSLVEYYSLYFDYKYHLKIEMIEHYTRYVLYQIENNNIICKKLYHNDTKDLIYDIKKILRKYKLLKLNDV